MAIHIGSLTIHHGYSPAYWVRQADCAYSSSRWEEASGYAFLGYTLGCRMRLYGDVGKYKSHTKPEMSPEDFRFCLSIRKSAEQFDKEGMEINTDDIYFELLRSKCVRLLGMALARGGFYNEAVPWLQMYLREGEFLVELDEDYVKGVKEALDEINEKIKNERRSEDTLRIGTKGMWDSPFDIDINQEGMMRLNDFFKYNLSAAENPIDLGMSLGLFQFDTKEPPPKGEAGKYPPIPEGSDNKDDIHFVRDKYKRPMLLYTGHPVEKDKVFFTERSLLSIPYGYNPLDSPGYCEWCCRLLPARPLNDQCCPAHQYAWCNPHESDQCKKIVDTFWHKCITEPVRLAQDAELKSSKDPSHIYLRAIQRIIQIYQKSPGLSRLHPLQLGMFPYMTAAHAGTPPWTFRTGIQEVLLLLWKEDIDPFTTTYFNIRSILILWRKLSVWYVDLPETPSSGRGMIAAHPKIAIFPLALSFVRVSCDPNCALQSNEDGKIRLVALRKIRKYEELTIPGPMGLDDDGRKDRLKELEKLGVYCGCSKCMWDRAVNEDAKLTRLKAEAEKRKREGGEGSETDAVRQAKKKSKKLMEKAKK